MDEKTKPKPAKLTYSVWAYNGPGVGWWLQEEGYDELTDAVSGLREAIQTGEATHGGAVIPDGTKP